MPTRTRMTAGVLSLSLLLGLSTPALSAPDPSGPVDRGFTVDGQPVPILSPEEALYWEWEPYPYVPPEPSLWVNGTEVEDADLMVEDGVSYTSAASLNAILGTSLTGDRAAIRQSAVDAGWDVVWNDFYRQIILLDRETLLKGLALPEEMESGSISAIQDFSKLDEFLHRCAAPVKAGGLYQTSETVDFSLTAFNTLDGDQTASGTFTASVVSGGRMAEADVTLSAAELLSLLPASALSRWESSLPQLRPDGLRGLLQDLTVKLIWNGETGDLYLNAPFLSRLDHSYHADSYLHWETNAGEAAILKFPDLSQWDTAQFLYDQLLFNSAWDSAASAYESFAFVKLPLGLFFGPDTFTEENGVLSWGVDTESLAERLKPAAQILDASGEEAEMLKVLSRCFKEYDLHMSVDRQGRQTVSAAVRPDTQAMAALMTEAADEDAPAWIEMLFSLFLGTFDVKMTSRAEGTAAEASGTMQYHWKNFFRLEMNTRHQRKETGTAPRALPPAGADIIEMEQRPSVPVPTE